MTDDKVARALRLFRIIDDVARTSEEAIMVSEEFEDGDYHCFYSCGVEWSYWENKKPFPKEADHDPRCTWRMARDFNNEARV